MNEKICLELYNMYENHISNITNHIGLNRQKKFCGINELSFEVPQMIMDSEQGMIINPDAELFKYNYFLNLMVIGI
jgi:hypothetical protein